MCFEKAFCIACEGGRKEKNIKVRDGSLADAEFSEDPVEQILIEGFPEQGTDPLLSGLHVHGDEFLGQALF